MRPSRLSRADFIFVTRSLARSFSFGPGTEWMSDERDDVAMSSSSCSMWRRTTESYDRW